MNENWINSAIELYNKGFSFLEGLRTELKAPKNKIYQLHTNKDYPNCSSIPKRISYSGKTAICIANFLYDSCTICLKRKKEKVENIVAVCGRNITYYDNGRNGKA